jgi:hypothetical protein
VLDDTRTQPARWTTAGVAHPQIDCGADTGVSRRHCQLNTDGQRWWVEDLQSSNGTYLSPAGGELPTDPIPAGQPSSPVAPQRCLRLRAAPPHGSEESRQRVR